MAKNTENALIAPKMAAEIDAWLRHLQAERQLSAKTIEAYRRDVQQFLHFLAGHCGGALSLKGLAALHPADVRAFLAARRADNIGSRSLMRALAAASGEDFGDGSTPQPARLARNPRVPLRSISP